MDTRARPLTAAEWDELGKRLERDAKRAQVDLVIAALLGVEQIAGGWLHEPELRNSIGAAVACALDVRRKAAAADGKERRQGNGSPKRGDTP